ncbi:MAG: hypothetical protein ACJATT_003610 [Myxococcota bacterium]|jgi:hypothetical protein
MSSVGGRPERTLALVSSINPVAHPCSIHEPGLSVDRASPVDCAVYGQQHTKLLVQNSYPVGNFLSGRAIHDLTR